MQLTDIERIITLIGALAITLAGIIKIPEMVITLSENKKKVN